jgi:hypothetical protein
MSIIRVRAVHEGTKALILPAKKWDFLNILAFLRNLISDSTNRDASGAKIDTSDELKSFVRTMDAELAKLGQDFHVRAGPWAARDPVSFGEWQADYGLLLARWSVAKADAERTLPGSMSMLHVHQEDPVSSFGLPARAGTILLGALKQDPSSITKGDLSDLRRRLQASRTAPVTPWTPPTRTPPAMTPEPPPVPASPDGGARPDPSGPSSWKESWDNTVEFVKENPITSFISGTLLAGAVSVAFTASRVRAPTTVVIREATKS